MSMHLTRAAIVAAATLLAACAPQDEQSAAATAAAPAAASVPAAANVVAFNATDFSYDGPTTIPAGLTTLRLSGQGREMHHLTVLRLVDGKTFADFEAAVRAGGPEPRWAVPVGGPNPSAPGDSAEVTQVLEPGEYALVCFVPSPDGKPHLMKGMMKALTVTPGAATVAELPTADIRMVLDDYRFTLDQPLTAGKHVIRVENNAEQPHEVVLVQLAPGKTPHDIIAWIDKPDGPPPGIPMGGVAGMVKGTVVNFPVDLAPGDYGFLCFLPDAKDKAPHFVHGMVQQFKVS
ncbi:MAG TPA: hypothetical protein VFY16_08395 [Gemmatimonadaceae bacterium]|nr:hypothetical protein [Gemmatimonadaceae bacterium]